MKYPPLGQHSLNTILSFLHSKQDCVFLETSKTDDHNFCSYIFHDPIEKLHFKKSDSLNHFFEAAEKVVDQGYYLAGWFAYEFGYALEPALRAHLDSVNNAPLATLGVFAEPIVYDHRTSTFSEPIHRLAPQTDISSLFTIKNVRPNITKEDYLQKLKLIKAYIEAGDTYQVNYTLKLLFDFSGSPEALYKSLRVNQPVSYSAYLKFDNSTILSFSPELFFHKNGDVCTVKPMKGTISRGMTFEDDQKRAITLNNDTKNRSENVMIVDLLRNDLGRLSNKGSVKMESMFDIETYATLHQMTSTIKGTLRSNLSIEEIFKAFFPCGSVTGAPKIRTMEIINETERFHRGVYTGGIGFISPEGTIKFNVPIRTVALDQKQSEMGIGSGIVHDSNHEDEWQECLLKAKFLTAPSPDFQIIETLLWTEETGFFLIEKHIERLMRSAAYFDYPCDKKHLKDGLSDLLKNNTPNEAGKIRILLYRDGHFEFTFTNCDLPKHLKFFPKVSTNKRCLPAITLSRKPVGSTSVFFYHKTTNRGLYADERAKALENNFFEVIFTNERNEITEGSISTIFIKKESFYFTPALNCGLLPGTFRSHLLEKYPDQVQEKIISLKDLHSADAIFLVNSVRGILQVSL